MIIDPTSNIGRIRLRISDIGDLPYLSDAIIQATLDDNDGNLPRTARACAIYVLGLLTHKTRRRLNQIEVYGSDVAKAYTAFLMLTYTNPAFMDISPIPYSSAEEFNSIKDFQVSWNKNYYSGTQSQSLAISADASPNDNSRTGLSSPVWGY